MTKSIIGYYSEPLTQKERDLMLGTLLPEHNRAYTRKMFLDIKAAIKEVSTTNSFLSLSLDQVIFQMNEMMQDELNKWRLKYSHVPEIQDKAKYNVVLQIENEMMLKVTLSQGFLDMNALKVSFRVNPNPYENDRKLIQDYNLHLYRTPGERTAGLSELGKEIDVLNTTILDMLDNNNCFSLWDDPVYDFSKVLLAAADKK